MPTDPGEPYPHTIHLGVGWEIAVTSTFVIVFIAVLTVSICQCSRNEPDLRGIELENGARSDKNWPASISNRRRRRRKKTRKTKTRDPDVTINLESEEIEAEEVESFEEDIQPLRMDGVGTGGGSRIEQQHVDVPKPTRCKSKDSGVSTFRAMI